jgi:hypothetical protein
MHVRRVPVPETHDAGKSKMNYNFPLHLAEPTPTQNPPHYFYRPDGTITPIDENFRIHMKHLSEAPDASSKERCAATRKERTKRWKAEQREAAAKRKEEGAKHMAATSRQQVNEQDADEGFCRTRVVRTEEDSLRNLKAMSGW